METNLKVFLSYCSKHSNLRDALKQLIPTLGPYEVITDQHHGQNYSTASHLMEDMVEKCDVAIFLLTDENAEGFFFELRSWLQRHSGKNAIIFKDREVRADIIHAKTGFSPAHTPFSADAPLSDIHIIIPALDNLFREGFAQSGLPAWQSALYHLRRQFNSKISDNKVPLDLIENVLQLISTKAKYKDPTEWQFRLSWHTESSDIDSYSRKINCLKLLEALLETEARQDEYEFIFKAIKRLVESGQNEPPPRRLLGSILFSGCSIATLQELQHTLGNHPYEKNAEFIESRLHHSEKVPQSPKSLLPPKNLLTANDNFERFLESQKLILNALSEICKYVDCSTIEITASHSFVMSSVDDEHEPLLAMACTATRTNKDTLSAISEVPLVMAESTAAVDDTEALIWYGQPYKRPTSEFRSHWLYHSRSAPRRVQKNLLLHFHPIELVDIYRRVFDGNKDGRFSTTVEELVNYIPVLFKGRGIDFHVDFNYKQHSSRSREFAMFMRSRVHDNGAGYSVIWKPNHGFWIFLDDRDHSDEKLINILIALDEISREAAETFEKVYLLAPTSG